MTYDCAIEKLDCSRIDKLNKLHDLATFYEDVKNMTKSVKSDHTIKRWQILADIRYREIQTEYKNRYFEYRNYLLNELGSSTMELVDAWIYGNGELPTYDMSSDSISCAHTLRMITTQCRIFKLI